MVKRYGEGGREARVNKSVKDGRIRRVVWWA